MERLDNTLPESDESPLNLTIGVMGSAAAPVEPSIFLLAKALGAAIAKRGCRMITGACPGLPLAAAAGAKEHGGLVVGISPALSRDEHLFKYESPTLHHDVLVYTGSGLMGREVVNIRTSDIVVIVGGSSGTLGEFAIAYDEGKLIGVLEGTGGITAIIPTIVATCQKKTGARIVYHSDPETLVSELIHVYKTSHYRRPSCFCHACETSSAETDSAARDVVCGMWIEPSRAIAKRTLDSRTFYFCSENCASRFDSSASTYAERVEP